MELIVPTFDLTGIAGVLVNAVLALMTIPVVRYAVPPVVNVLKRVVPVNPALIAGVLTVIVWALYTVYAAAGQEQQFTDVVELLVPLLIALGGADLSSQAVKARYESAKAAGAPGYQVQSAYQKRQERKGTDSSNNVSISVPFRGPENTNPQN